MQVQRSKNGYKQTEVWELPDDWKTVSLEEAAQKGNDTFVDGPFGSDLKVNDYTNSGIMLIQLQNVGDGVFYPENKKYTSEGKYNQLIRHATQPGDIVISKMSDPVGRACIIPPVSDKLLVVADCVKLRPDESKFDKLFLMHAINSLPVRKQAIEKSMGTTRLRIRLTELKKLKIPMPPLKEQQRIASIISKVDELIQKTDQVIGQTQSLSKGLMLKLFTKGVRFSTPVESPMANDYAYENENENWKLLTVEEIKSDVPNAIVMGPFGSSIKTDNFVSSGIPVIRGVNLTKEPFNLEGFVFLTEKKANELRSANAFPKDLVFTHRGTLGQVGIIPENTKYKRFIISQSQMKLTCNPNIADPMYVYYFFRSPVGQNALLRNVSSTGVPAIGQPTTTLRRIKIPIPSLWEQHKIAHFLSSLDWQIQNYSRYNEHVKKIKMGLMQNLLTGKIRVK